LAQVSKLVSWENSQAVTPESGCRVLIPRSSFELKCHKNGKIMWKRKEDPQQQMLIIEIARVPPEKGKAKDPVRHA